MDAAFLSHRREPLSATASARIAGPAACAALYLTTCLALGSAVADEPARLQQTLAGDAVASLGIEAGLGSVQLIGHAGPDIRVEVSLSPRSDGVAVDDPSRVLAAIDAATLERIQGDGEVRFAVKYPLVVMVGAVEERWRIVAPQTIGARVQMAVGDLRVEDIRGGVDLTLGVGDIGIDVPGGDMRAQLSVGNIVATTAAPDPGRVLLQTNVGRVNMRQAGRLVPAAARSAGPGSQIARSGAGSDWLILSSDVGDVFLEVRDAGD